MNYILYNYFKKIKKIINILEKKNKKLFLYYYICIKFKNSI